MKNWKRWLKRGAITASGLAVAYAVVSILAILINNSVWAEAKMDITMLFADSQCIAEYGGEKLLLCDRTTNSIFKFLQSGEIMDREMPQGGEEMRLTLEDGSVTVTDAGERAAYLTIQRGGKTEVYHVRLQFSFESFVRVFNGSAGENFPVSE